MTLRNDDPGETITRLAREGWMVQSDEGFIEHVGPLLELREPEATRFGFIADRRHANLLGVVQGGMLMTFADRALGLRAWEVAGGIPYVTVQFDMLFLSAARMGDFVELRPEVIRQTATLVFLRGTLTVGSRSVAAASGIWKRLPAAQTMGTGGT